MTREDALVKEEYELARNEPPKELLRFLSDNNMNYPPIKIIVQINF
jgi:hypothetical protein